MTEYWISTEVREILDDVVRRKALTDEITKLSALEWDETTSFHLIQTTLDIDQLAARLKAKINPKFDMVVIRKLNTKEARYIGKFDDEQTLLEFHVIRYARLKYR